MSSGRSSQDGDIEFVDAVAGGDEEELDVAPPRRPWPVIAALVLLAAVVAVAVRTQHSAPSAAGSAPASAPRHAGPIIPTFRRGFPASSDPDSSTADDGPVGVEFPVPAAHPTATITLDPQLPNLLGPSQCEPCSSNETILAPVRRAVRAAFPGQRVVDVTSAIDRAHGLHRPLVGRSVLATGGGGRSLFVLLQRQVTATATVRQTSADGRIRTFAAVSRRFYVQISAQGASGHLPGYTRLARLARDPRLIVKP